MCKRQIRLFLPVATLLVFGLSPVHVGWQAFAAGLPEGVTLEVLAEYGPPGIPGIEKATLKRLAMQPGTKLEDVTLTYEQLLPHRLRRPDSSEGRRPTAIIGQGSQWFEPKGLVYKVIRNDGDVPAVDVFLALTQTE
jgi:hypothetical protein